MNGEHMLKDKQKKNLVFNKDVVKPSPRIEVNAPPLNTSKDAPAISIKSSGEDIKAGEDITADTREVVRIETNGDVFWLKDGVMTKCEMDKDLAQAFALVVIEITGLDASNVIKEILRRNKYDRNTK